MSVTRGKLDEFRTKINEYAANALTEESMIPTVDADLEIVLSDTNIDLADSLRILEPYGVGNPVPNFIVRSVNLTEISPISEGKHTRLAFSDGKNVVEMEPEIFEATRLLREFLFEVVYSSKQARGEEVKAERMLSALYEYYTKYPEQMSEYNGEQIEKWGVETVVCDYLSGMTDRYAVSTFNSIFIPKNWKI